MSRPIKILFDANPLVRSNKSGVGYYTYQLINELAKAYPAEVMLVGHYFNFLGRTSNKDLPRANNISYIQSRVLPGKVLSLTRRLGFQLPLETFFKQRGDIALFTNFVSLPSIFKIHTFVAVHDLCYEEVPQFVSEKNRNFLRKFVPRSIERAAKVITISESTRQAIQKHYSVPDDKFIVTPIPAEPKIKSDKKDLGKLGIEGDYLLFIGTLEPRKNIIGLVRAYELLPREIRDAYPLVLSGGPGWYMEETLSHISKLQQKGEKIILTGYISDEHKAALYENATLFILPSHYEGFGMPILEAMNYGIPSAVSDIPVFHEVAANASAYFDKENPNDIANIVADLLAHPEKRNKLVALGNERLKSYSWSRVAKQVYEALRAIA